jgi:lactoylglutathione lyase
MHYLHTMIRVHNLDAALHFFCDGLGLVPMSRTDYPQGRFTLVFLAAPGDALQASERKAPMLELTYNWPDAQGEVERYTGGRNFGHVAYRVENLYATCERLAAQGVTILRPPRDGHMAFVRSPDGISVELLQQGEALPPQEPWASMPNTGSW